MIFFPENYNFLGRSFTEARMCVVGRLLCVGDVDPDGCLDDARPHAAASPAVSVSAQPRAAIPCSLWQWPNR